MAHNPCIIAFIRSPEKGMVKSRLAAFLGEETACVLYKSLVTDLMETLCQDPNSFVIAFHPPGAGTEMENWLGREHVFMPQAGYDLGERMKNAFMQVFSTDINSVVLIGSDIPDLSNKLIEAAFSSLHDHDAVIGPSQDGGYYLIGFNKDVFIPSVFEGIEWSTPDVFRQTMDILTKKDCRIHVLPEHRDIDTLNDLTAFYRDSINRGFTGSATMRYLQSDMAFLLRLQSASETDNPNMDTHEQSIDMTAFGKQTKVRH